MEDKEFIIKYLNGDEKAFELLVSKYLKQIYNFIYRRTGNVAESEDITQEVFVKVWKNIKKFNLEKDFKPWIFTIAQNTLIDFFRKRKTTPFSKFENEKGQNALVDNLVGKSLNLLENFDNKRTLAIVTESLTVNEQKMISLRHNEGMSFKEIAEIFEESINTVKSRYRRIIIGLRKRRT